MHSLYKRYDLIKLWVKGWSNSWGEINGKAVENLILPLTSMEQALILIVPRWISDIQGLIQLVVQMNKHEI